MTKRERYINNLKKIRNHMMSKYEELEEINIKKSEVISLDKKIEDNYTKSVILFVSLFIFSWGLCIILCNYFNAEIINTEIFKTISCFKGFEYFLIIFSIIYKIFATNLNNKQKQLYIKQRGLLKGDINIKLAGCSKHFSKINGEKYIDISCMHPNVLNDIINLMEKNKEMSVNDAIKYLNENQFISLFK